MRFVSFTLAAVLAFGTACDREDRSVTNSHTAAGHNSGNMAVNQSETNHSQMDHSSMQSSPNAASAPYDLQFLDTMTVHHQAAVDMAKAIDGRTQHAELNALAKKIISDQEKEIAQMNKWRDEWFAGAAPAINMEMTGMGDSMKTMDMKGLRTLSGNALDIEFVKQMIPHHQGASQMASEARQRSQRDEIKTLAAQIINEQNAEILQMQGWLDAWTK